MSFRPTTPTGTCTTKLSGARTSSRLDAENRRNMQAYINNIYIMEQLTRVQTNLALLRKHQADNLASPKRTLEVELLGVRIGDLVLVTFPGELTVQIGLNIKQMSPHDLDIRGRLYQRLHLLRSDGRSSWPIRAELRKIATVCWHRSGNRSSNTKWRRCSAGCEVLLVTVVRKIAMWRAALRPTHESNSPVVRRMNR